MTGHRLARLESLFKREISDIIRNEIKNVDFGLITITKVMLSGDLRYAKVYVSIYDKEPKQKKAMEILKRYSGFVKGIIGRRISIHHIPDINFIHDKSMEEASRIFQIMQDIKKESAQKNSAGPKKE
jgi:ribosome-binding factor A